MPDESRRAVLCWVGAAVATAGCSARDGGGGEESGTQRPESTTVPPAETTRTPTDREPTPTEPEPEADHAIRVGNDGTEPRTIRVRIVEKASGETVFETTETVDPGVTREVYNLEEANPLGVEEFMIHGRVIDPATAGGNGTAAASAAGDETTAVTTTDTDLRSSSYVETSGCYGDATVIWYGESLGIVFSSIC
jgi:hypothetical protein